MFPVRRLGMLAGMKAFPVIAWLMCVMGSWASAARLINPGFETGDFAGWNTGGQNWRISSWQDDQRRGSFGAVSDVFTNDPGNEFRVVAQDIKVSGEKHYTAEVWIRATCVESTESFLEVQFFDKNGEALTQFQSAHVKQDQEFTRVVITNMPSPKTAVKASVRGVLYIVDTPKQDTDWHVFDHFDFDLLSPSELRKLAQPDPEK